MDKETTALFDAQLSALQAINRILQVLEPMAALLSEDHAKVHKTAVTEAQAHLSEAITHMGKVLRGG